MIPVRSPFPPGIVVVVTADLTRYPDFWNCIQKLYVPQGTEWAFAQGTSIESNRNAAIAKFLKPEHQWVYTIDDDHDFKPDTLMWLLQRMWSDERIDILQGMCVTRKPPYLAYAYRKEPEATQLGVGYKNAQWDEIPATGVSEWDAVGTGGMLFRRTIIDAMQYPWFEAGRTSKDHIGGDLCFCTKAKELGFRVWMDSEHTAGHITKATLIPVHSGEGWALGLDMGNDTKFTVTPDEWAHAKFEEI